MMQSQRKYQNEQRERPWVSFCTVALKGLGRKHAALASAETCNSLRKISAFSTSSLWSWMRSHLLHSTAAKIAMTGLSLASKLSAKCDTSEVLMLSSRSLGESMGRGKKGAKKFGFTVEFSTVKIPKSFPSLEQQKTSKNLTLPSRVQAYVPRCSYPRKQPKFWASAAKK